MTTPRSRYGARDRTRLFSPEGIDTSEDEYSFHELDEAFGAKFMTQQKETDEEGDRDPAESKYNLEKVKIKLSDPFPISLINSNFLRESFF